MARTWWGHPAHNEVDEAVVQRVQARVLGGMGLIVLHSAHHSRIFKRLMGTTCDLKWRDANEHERRWVVEPGHPIAAGLGETLESITKRCMASASTSLCPRPWCS